MNETQTDTDRQTHEDLFKTILLSLSCSVWRSGGGNHAGPFSRTVGAVCSGLGGAVGVTHLSAGYASP